MGDAVPQTPWDFSLWSLKRQGHAEPKPGSPLWYRPPGRHPGRISAECHPRLERRSSPRHQKATQQASALVSFCSPSLLLLTTNCLLLLSQVSPFARTATRKAAKVQRRKDLGGWVRPPGGYTATFERRLHEFLARRGGCQPGQ